MSSPASGRPRIAIAGLSVESSTFSPARTRIADLRPRRGNDVLDHYAFLQAGAELRSAADWVPVLQGRAIPGGAVPLEDYLQLKQEILAGLQSAQQLDGLVLDIHGAMSVVGMDDAEGDLAATVRQAVGPEVVISTGMDLHGNVSWKLAETVDLLTCYRMAPHEDALETKERAIRNLIDVLQTPGRPRPAKAWVPVPILLPGEKTSTRIEPAKSLYAKVPDIEALPDVLDAGIWIGYAWADEPRNMAVVMVTGSNADTAAREATNLAQEVWRRRAEFNFVAPSASLDECIKTATASKQRPFFISDSGDNPTAGGAGDVSWTLVELLERDELISGDLTAIYASIPASEAVETCVSRGIGVTVELHVGALSDAGPSGPARLTGIVEHIHHGDPVAEIEVVVRVGGLHVILTKSRKPYHLEADFLRNGLKPREADVVIVKIGYLEPELFEMAADWMLALTPGGVDQDLLRLGHSRIDRPMFPFDRHDSDPDLHARLVPTVGQ
ncbi:M81 family metallopeptidase [Arthrobacter castelli]|uniref:M81 family metallopeptidase n=1 Tax=Arthrobacter castelli TaxID=271431 RepID=UPI000425F50C|nr:M81 family metallopeptidase [Arthrobacter castelli]